MTAATALFDASVAVATATSALYAKQRRTRAAVALLVFFGLTFAAELARNVVFAGAQPLSMGWYVASALSLLQCTTVLGLALIALAHRLPWLAIALYGVALAVLLVEPRSVRWLYSVTDLLAMAGAGACIGVWWWSDRPLDLPAQVTILCVVVTGIGVVAHGIEKRFDAALWDIHAGANVIVVAASVILIWWKGLARS